MLISCSRCGHIHERGKCPIKREHKTKRTKERAFRSTKTWTNQSVLIRKRDNYLCAVCLHHDPPRYTTARLQVHHIEPLAEDWERRLDPVNLLTVCPVCHELAESGAIPRSVLHSWALEASKRDGLI